MVVNQFNRFGQVIAIGDHNFGMVLFYRDRDRLIVTKVEDLCSVDHGMDRQDTEQYLILAGDDDIIWPLYLFRKTKTCFVP